MAMIMMDMKMKRRMINQFSQRRKKARSKKKRRKTKNP
jgi:hypothetical protein